MPAKYALIIGNTEYTDSGLAKLNAPGKDAQDFARALKSAEIAAFDEVVTFMNESVSNLNEAIEDFFTGKKPDDLLVFYFSGHGVRDESGSLFLAVKNTNRSRLRSTSIKTDFVRDLMDQSRSRRQVIILDCCNSGAFAYGAKAETGGAMGIGTTFEETGYGRVVLTATDSTQFAWEGDKIIGDETVNSLFTHFLVKGLEGEADEDGDGKITVDELYDYVYEQIVSRTPKQTPGKWSYKQQGEIVLRQSARIKDIKPIPLPADLIAATENTIPFVREGAVKQLESLLKGRNIGLAHSAREALERMAGEDDSRRIAQLAAQALASAGQNGVPTDEDKKANEEAHRLAAQKREKERKAKENLEADNRLRAAREKTEREKLARKNAEIYNRSRTAAFKAAQNFLPKLKTPALVLVVLLIGYLLWQGVLALMPASPDPTETETPLAAFTVTPPTKTITPTLTKTLIPTPTLGPGSTMIGEKGETLVYVPAGEFTMGSDAGASDEKPVHTVYLDAFWIDQTEVTNKQYQACVDAGTCEPPSSTSSYTHPNYYGNPEFDNYPVIYVNWDKANRYCEVWTGGDLPTEAEWEKAARGTDERTYPWGEDISCDKANYQSSCVGDTSPVRSYKSGKSPYEVYDMAGNVWEWVNDYYQSDYYAALGGSASNPQGPSSSDARVLRGGSWSADNLNARSANRNWITPVVTSNVVGFRCARSP
jgi:formylglycine-generating enzyme required for sulfatase activity